MNPLLQLPIPLLEWYREQGRDLPWRKTSDPYAILVSELMLQQTRVTAVLGYWARFLGALPTFEALAAAPEDKLLKLWEGLGYYSRARNLQKAARQVMEDFGGVFPRDYGEIRSLSGVGDYTAAALSSLLYGAPTPAVDGNLLRVTARLTGDFDDITTGAMKKKVTAALTQIIPLEAPGPFNQAMMDLGAMVCLPNGAPLCHRCPASDFCVAYQKNLTAALPVRSRKKARRMEERAVLFLFHHGRVALRRRPDRGLLAGLWEFPCEASVEDGAPFAPLGFSGLTLAGAGRHIFTHVEWHMTAYVLEGGSDELPQGWVWADRASLGRDYAIPSAFSSFASIWEGYL